MSFHRSFSKTEPFLPQLLAMKSAGHCDPCLFWFGDKLSDGKLRVDCYLVFHKTEEGCTGPGGAAIPGRCVERMEQAPFSTPIAKNPFNMLSPDRGHIRY